MRSPGNPFRALPALEERIAESARAGRGMMAHVVASDGHMVTVETATSKGAIGPYPSTVAALAPGSPGVLQPLRGNQHLFVATGVGLMTPFGASRTGVVTGSGGVPHAEYISIPLTLHAGVYRFMATGHGTLGKSTNNGTLYLSIYIGNTTTSTSMGSGTLSINSRTQLAHHRDMEVSLAAPGTVDVRLTFTHGGAAGTVTMYQGALSGWYQRIR